MKVRLLDFLETPAGLVLGILGGICVLMVMAALATSPANSARVPTMAVTDRLGPDTPVLPFDFATAYAYCPSGYIATGGGSYAGAIEHVSDGRTANGRGWFVDGFNPSDSSVYSHAVDVVCARGTKLLRVRAAGEEDRIKQARRAFLGARG